MRAVVQRVSYGEVQVNNQTVGKIDQGLVVLLGVGIEDTEEDARYLAEKIAHLRIFEDAQGKMNLSVQEVGGAILAISQFTLYGDVKKGRRPSFTEAAPPEEAEGLYEKFVEYLRGYNLRVESGIFQAKMLVIIHNDGPVTLMLESRKSF